jgi:hypothetical protein
LLENLAPLFENLLTVREDLFVEPSTVERLFGGESSNGRIKVGESFSSCLLDEVGNSLSGSIGACELRAREERVVREKELEESKSTLDCETTATTRLGEIDSPPDVAERSLVNESCKVEERLMCRVLLRKVVPDDFGELGCDAGESRTEIEREPTEP